MYEIVFYSDRSGEAPVLQYMTELRNKNSKDSRIKLNKIAQYLYILEEKGLQAGVPIIKHLDGEIWELRPIRDRILFAGVCGGRFVLLHCFLKQTQKTPA